MIPGNPPMNFYAAGVNGHDARLRVSVYTLAYSVLVFFWLFRPQILHPLGSAALIPAGLGMIYLVMRPQLAAYAFERLGPVFFVLLGFIMLFSLFVDMATGAFGTVGARSQFFTALRLVITLLGAVYVTFVLSRGDMGRFKSLVLLAIALQLVIGLAMVYSLEFKRFMYMNVSGYSGTEKLFYHYYFDSRIFGWSEELFFLAPVAMVFATMIFMPRATPLWILFALAVLLLSLFNARLSVFGLLFGLLIGFRGRLLLPLLALAAGVTVAAVMLRQLIEIFLIEFQDGGIRTLRILIEGHIHNLLQDYDWIFGGHYYLYAGPDPPAFSDIGLVIILNYGGAIYLAAWLGLAWCIVYRAFHTKWNRVMAYSLFLVAAIKGLAFSGNALLGLFIGLALLGGYRETQRNPGRLNNRVIRSFRKSAAQGHPSVKEACESQFQDRHSSRPQ